MKPSNRVLLARVISVLGLLLLLLGYLWRHWMARS
jgi:hypothetical protein